MRHKRFFIGLAILICVFAPFQTALAHYVSEAGRFSQRDPLFFVGSSSAYETELASPLTLKDPSGKGLDCPPGWVQVPRYGYEPTISNPPCGTQGGIPINPSPPAAGGANFTPACEKHDLCYQDCSSTRDGCDQNFKNDLYKICDQQHPDDATAREKCKQAADAWWLALTMFGGSAYTDAQNAACFCAPGCGTDPGL